MYVEDELMLPGLVPLPAVASGSSGVSVAPAPVVTPVVAASAHSTAAAHAAPAVSRSGASAVAAVPRRSAAVVSASVRRSPPSATVPPVRRSIAKRSGAASASAASASAAAPASGAAGSGLRRGSPWKQEPEEDIEDDVAEVVVVSLVRGETETLQDPDLDGTPATHEEASVEAVATEASQPSHAPDAAMVVDEVPSTVVAPPSIGVPATMTLGSDADQEMGYAETVVDLPFEAAEDAAADAEPADASHGELMAESAPQCAAAVPIAAPMDTALVGTANTQTGAAGMEAAQLAFTSTAAEESGESGRAGASAQAPIVAEVGASLARRSQSSGGGPADSVPRRMDSGPRPVHIDDSVTTPEAEAVIATTLAATDSQRQGPSGASGSQAPAAFARTGSEVEVMEVDESADERSSQAASAASRVAAAEGLQLPVAAEALLGAWFRDGRRRHEVRLLGGASQGIEYVPDDEPQRAQVIAREGTGWVLNGYVLNVRQSTTNVLKWEKKIAVPTTMRTWWRPEVPAPAQAFAGQSSA